jgi:hypothetical protein
MTVAESLRPLVACRHSVRSFALAMLALGFLGCASGDDPGAAFVGTWTGTLATDGVCLDGSTISRTTFAVQASITKGADSDLVQTSQAGMACVIRLSLHDSVATFVDLGGSCATPDGRPLMLRTWSLDLLGKNQIAESGGGSFDAPAAGGTCTVGFNGTLTR